FPLKFVSYLFSLSFFDSQFRTACGFSSKRFAVIPDEAFSQVIEWQDGSKFFVIRIIHSYFPQHQHQKYPDALTIDAPPEAFENISVVDCSIEVGCVDFSSVQSLPFNDPAA